MSLSERNRRFAEAIVYGEAPSITQAFRDTRQTEATPKNVRAEASRLWRSTEVQRYAETLRQDLLVRGRARAAADRERIVSALWREAEAADRASDRIAALRTLGSVGTIDLFGSDRSTPDSVGQSSSAAEVAASIQALLADTLDDPEVGFELDVTPDPQPPLRDDGHPHITTHDSAQTITDSVAIPPQETVSEDALDGITPEVKLVELNLDASGAFDEYD
jgi:hypothetical protein